MQRENLQMLKQSYILLHLGGLCISSIGGYVWLYETCVLMLRNHTTILQVYCVVVTREQAQTDVSSWRQKYESAVAAAESEEAEEMSSKRKTHAITARMTECETQLASAVAKTAALEKVKNQLQLDADSLAMQLDKVDNLTFIALV